MSTTSDNGTIQSFIDKLRRLALLQLDYARLSFSEKLTVLLSTIAFYAMLVAFGSIMLVFVSIGIGHLLATTIAPHLAYLFVAAFYLLIFILLVIFRKKIFVDPTARLLTRLFVNPPEE